LKQNLFADASVNLASSKRGQEAKSTYFVIYQNVKKKFHFILSQRDFSCQACQLIDSFQNILFSQKSILLQVEKRTKKKTNKSRIKYFERETDK
jgi:hypothetical protein